MIMKPPHLPPEICDIKKHEQWQRLKILLAAAAFGLVSGLSGASILLGWIWPGVDKDDWWSSARFQSGLSRSQLEERAQKEAAERIVEIYMSVEYAGAAGYLPRKNKLGDALVVSSDGWAVMRAESYAGAVRATKALLSDGNVYGVEKVLFDRYAGMAYLKIAPAAPAAGSSQFKVASFAESFKEGDIFVRVDGEWRYGWAERATVSPAVSAHADFAPVTAHAVSASFPAGTIAVNAQGRVVGIVGGDGRMLAATRVTRVLPSILSAQKIVYPTLGAEGWHGEEQPAVVNGQEVKGFLVARVFGKSVLRRGDIVQEINGQIATPDSLWYNIEGKKTAKLKVWRSGKILEIDAPVSRI